MDSRKTVEHTPGPWVVELHPRTKSANVVGWRAKGAGAVLATVHEYPGVDLEANAALLAAAPDLLIAAEAMLVGKPSRFDVERLRAAIAAARGVKP